MAKKLTQVERLKKREADIKAKYTALMKKKGIDLKAKIREAEKEERKKEAERDRQRATVIGKALIAEMKKNEALGEQLLPILDKHIRTARDRNLVGLPPKK